MLDRDLSGGQEEGRKRSGFSGTRNPRMGVLNQPCLEIVWQSGWDDIGNTEMLCRKSFPETGMFLGQGYGGMGFSSNRSWGVGACDWKQLDFFCWTEQSQIKHWDLGVSGKSCLISDQNSIKVVMSHIFWCSAKKHETKDGYVEID